MGLMFTLLLCGGAAAQEGAIQAVPVDSVRNPQMKSYRAVAAGIDAYARKHDLAPEVTELRFRIGSKEGEFIHDPELTLRIVADDLSLPVPVSVDGVFTVPWSLPAYEKNASLIFNRRDGSYQIAPEVRTPGLPENVRRLGDLRLECQVAVAIAKQEIPTVIIGITNMVLLSSDWCMTTKGDVHFSYPSQQPLRKATISYGTKKRHLEVLDRSYKVPLGERQWPDDAVIELEYERPKMARETAMK